MNQESDLFPARLLLPTRVVWAALALLFFVFFLIGVVPNFEEHASICLEEECSPTTLTQLEADILEEKGFSLTQYSVFLMTLEITLDLIFTALSILLIWQPKPLRMGVLSSFFFLFLGPIFFGESVRAVPLVWPQLEITINVLSSISVVLFVLMLHLFPDGRFFPRWNRYWIPPLCLLLVLDPYIFQSVRQSASGSFFVVVGGMGAAILGLFFQVYRFRFVSTPVEKQQTKWVMLGLILLFMGMLPWMIFVEISPLEPGLSRLIFNLSLLPQDLLIVLFPILMVVSIRRHRLWDIDLILRKSLQYGVLTGAILLIYFGTIVIMQSILQAMTGQGDSPIATVLTTLLVAALFNPLRNRAQELIDRRFFRAKYDADQALTRFAAAARDEVDLSRLVGEILVVVQESMRPEALNLWISAGEFEDDTISRPSS